MILLVAVIAGTLAGLLRAGLKKRPLVVPTFRAWWLLVAAFVPQWLAFQFRPTRTAFSDDLARGILLSTLAVLCIFVWLNRKQRGFWMLGLGLLLNLAVISLNRGFMPIQPHTVEQILPGAEPGSWQVGQRLGTGKDIVLTAEETRLPWLGDRFLLPAWFPDQVAFSLGDIFIALGVFWILWQIGQPAANLSLPTTERNQEWQPSK